MFFLGVIVDDDNTTARPIMNFHDVTNDAPMVYIDSIEVDCGEVRENSLVSKVKM